MTTPTAAGPSSGPARITALDGIRGLAILAVVLHHAFAIKLLWMGVDLFFVLSGFLITTILVRSKGPSFRRYIGHFYRRRAQRILPPYLLLLLIGSLVYGTFWLHEWYFYLGAMNFLKVLNLPAMPIVPLWSLAIEEQFYLVWPLAVFFLNRRQLIACSAALMLLAPILRFTCTPLFHRPWAIYMLLPFRMDCLACGALLSLLWPVLHARLSCSPALCTRLWIATAAAVLFSFTVLGFFGHRGIGTHSGSALGNAFIYEAALLLVTSLFLFALSGGTPRLFAFRPLVWLGTISYSVYLIHTLLLNCAFNLQLHSADPQPKVAALLAIVAALLYAAASWYWLEKPILSLGHPDSQLVAAQVQSKQS